MIVNISNKYKGFLIVDEITVLSKDTKTQFTREVLNKPNAVAALVYDTVKEKYIFVSQWRPGCSADLVEIVAGIIDKEGENPDNTISREIMEEIGYSVDRLKFLTDCYVSPGSTTEKVRIYYAEVSDKVNSGGGLAIENEEIDIVEMSESELNYFMSNPDNLMDAKTLLAIALSKK